MSAVHRAVASARRRLWLQDWLTSLGRAVLIGLACAAVLLLVERLFSLRLWLWSYPLAGAVAMLVCSIRAWRRRVSMDAAAAQLDDRLELKDRLATALYAEQIEDDPFARQVVAEAERMAMQTPVSQVFAVRLQRVWTYVPIAAVLLLILVLLLPQWDVAGLEHAREQRAAEQAQAEAAQEELQQVADLVKRIEQQQDSDPEVAEALESIGQLAQLSEKQLQTPKLRRDAAAKLSDAADKLDRTIEQKQQQSDALANMLSNIESSKSGPADKLVESLRRADFESAAEALDSVIESAEGMAEPERKELAEQLKRVAEDLEKQSDRQAEQQQQAQAETQKALKEAGLDREQIEQLKQQDYEPKAVEEALKESGADQQQAEQTAKKVKQQQQKQQQSGERSETSGGLASALGRLSQTLSDAAQQGQADESRQSTPAAPEKQGADAPQESKQGSQGSGGKPADSDQGQSKSGQSTQGQEQTSPSSSGAGEPTPQPGESGPAGQQSGMRQAAKDAKQQIEQLAAGQRQLKQMRQSQQQIRQAMRKIGGQRGDGAGVGGSDWGRGDGGDVLGQRQQIKPAKTHAVGILRKADPKGKVITSWTNDGKIARGQAEVEFDLAVTRARVEAESAVTEDRVPRRYHRSVQEYFKLADDEAP